MTTTWELVDGSALTLDGVYYGDPDNLIGASIVGQSSATTITDLLAGDPFYVAHRGGSLDWPEETVYAYQQSILNGAKALEISVWQSSDGIWVCSHDQSLLRVTGTDVDIPTTAWPDMEDLEVGPDDTNDTDQPSRPLAKMTDVLDAYAGEYVIFIDNKGQDDRSNFLDLIDSYPNSTSHFVFKGFVTSTAMADDAKARGYTTWGYAYEDSVGDFASRVDSWDMLGMDYQANEAAWTTTLSYGKTTIAHIIPSAAAATTALALGADGLMVSGVKEVIPS